MSILWAFWGDDWSLYHKVTFDGENKLIIINPGEDNIDVKVDIYSDWKEWVTLRDNGKFLPALRTIGGDPTEPGQYAGDMYFCINGWRVVINHFVVVRGILYSDDYDLPYIINPGGGVYNKVSNLAIAYSATGGAPTVEEIRQEMDTNSTKLTAIKAKTDTIIPAPTVAEIVTATWDEPTLDHLSAGSMGLTLAQTKADTANITINVATILNIVATIQKYNTNRTKIDKIAKTLTVYDDDCTTPLIVFDLKDSTGAPSVLEVCERVPPGC